MIWLGIILIALLTSMAYVRYIQGVAKNKAGQAALADFSLMLLASLSTQIWALQGNDFRVFLLFDLVAALGTYIAVRYRNVSL